MSEGFTKVSRANAEEIKQLMMKLGLIGKAALAMVSDEEIDRALEVHRWWEVAGPIVDPTGYLNSMTRQPKNRELLQSFAAWRKALRDYGLTEEIE